MTCVIKESVFHPTISELELPTVPVSVINYCDGTWAIKFGEYGATFYLNGTEDDISKLFIVFGNMLHDEAVRQAVESGDYETEPKEDERNTDAWLNLEG
jgi:hypothetical protein